MYNRLVLFMLIIKTWTDFTDCLNDRKTGFIGKIAIHPAQAEVINTAFTPSDEEIKYAERVVAVFEQNPVLV